MICVIESRCDGYRYFVACDVIGGYKGLGLVYVGKFKIISKSHKGRIGHNGAAGFFSKRNFIRK